MSLCILEDAYFDLSKLYERQPLFIKISNDMAFLYDLETDIRFKQGKEIGYKIGFEKGLEKVRLEAEAKAKAEELKRLRPMIVKVVKSGRCTIQEVAGIFDVPVKVVRKIHKKLVKKKAKK